MRLMIVYNFTGLDTSSFDREIKPTVDFLRSLDHKVFWSWEREEHYRSINYDPVLMREEYFRHVANSHALFRIANGKDLSGGAFEEYFLLQTMRKPFFLVYPGKSFDDFLKSVEGYDAKKAFQIECASGTPIPFGKELGVLTDKFKRDLENSLELLAYAWGNGWKDDERGLSLISDIKDINDESRLHYI